MERKHLGWLIAIAGVLLLVNMVFIKLQLDEQAASLCEAIEVDPTRTMEDCPAHRSPYSWYLLSGFLIALAIIIAGSYIASTPEKVKLRPKPATLDEEEQRIHDLLKESEGSMYQSDLVKETGLSKVKITRVLDKMESKGLIDRKRRGMTNIVVLK